MKRKRKQAQIDEMLSAYLDGELSPRERARLEARLETDPELRARLEALRQTVALVRGLPLVHAPRNFLLTPSMVELERPRRAPYRWLAPALTFATAVSGLLCVAVIVGSLLTGGVGLLATGAPATPAYEIAAEQPPEETTPAFALSAPAEVEGMEITPEHVAEETELASGVPTSTPEALLSTKTAQPPPMERPQPTEAPVPPAAQPTPTAAHPVSPMVGAARAGPGTETPTPQSLAMAEAETPSAPPPALRVESLPWALAGGLFLLTLGLGVASALAWRARRR